METIGLFVITRNRFDYFKQCIESLEENNWGGATHKGVIDDASTQPEYKDYLKELETKGITVYRFSENVGVGRAKNQALRMMHSHLDKHLFLMEDDILMNTPYTCNEYIAYAENIGIKHLNFGLHGELNKKELRFKYGEISCFPQCVGAFSYYHEDILEKVGYIDENFYNAWEHVEYTYRIIKAGLHPPFWCFADHPNSEDLLREIPGSIHQSSIRPRSDWGKNVHEGMMYWLKKHGEWLPPKK